MVVLADGPVLLTGELDTRLGQRVDVTRVARRRSIRPRTDPEHPGGVLNIAVGLGLELAGGVAVVDLGLLGWRKALCHRA